VGKALPERFALLYAGNRNGLLIGWDAVQELTPAMPEAFTALRHALIKEPDWWLGHLSYDLKNELEALQSEHPDGIGFPVLSFFRPRVVVKINGLQAELLHFNEPAEVLAEVQQQLFGLPAGEAALAALPKLLARHSKADYLKRVRTLQQHIRRGDIYEINFCQEFYAEGVELQPAALFARLDARTRAPFACYLKHRYAHLLCGSPERFMAKTGQRIFSQPIKGTIRRGLSPAEVGRLQSPLILFRVNQARRPRGQGRSEGAVPDCVDGS